MRRWFALALFSAVGCAEPEPDRIGGCVLTQPTGIVPNDLYAVSPFDSTDRYGDFTKTMHVAGVQLIAQAEVPDSFLEAVGAVLLDILDPQEVSHPSTQALLVEHLYRYRATIPVFHGEPDFEREEPSFGQAEEENSICDIIMEGVDGQVMEVVEHLLHILTDVGLHYTYPDEWGIGTTSTLATSMQSAIDDNVFRVHDYNDIPEGAEKQRILMQEFGYWVLTSAWDIQTPYGPSGNQEWTASTLSSLQSQVPTSYALHEQTTATVLRAPTAASLEGIQLFEAR